MIKVSAIYERSTGRSFDQDYYLNTHIPLAKGILSGYGLVKIEADIFESLEGIIPARLFAMTHAFFPENAELEKLFQQEGMGEIVTDVANYTDTTPYLQVSRVVSG